MKKKIEFRNIFRCQTKTILKKLVAVTLNNKQLGMEEK